MATTLDIRWRQRLENLDKAYAKLSEAVSMLQEIKEVSAGQYDLMCEGLVHRFEFTHELAWNVMKDYEEYQGDFEVRGARDAMRKALAIGLISDAAWMESINDRNRTSHNYDSAILVEVVDAIINRYYPLLTDFLNVMHSIE